jgi:NADH-ubiquinone oxidoreductase chain 6
VAVLSFLIRVVVYLTCFTVWFSLLLIILFLSGIIVIFVYVSSLAHNEPYSYPLNYTYLGLTSVAVVSVLNEKNKRVFLRDLSLTNLAPHFIVYKAYSFGVYLFTALLIVYLFISLVVVVKLATSCEFPLRAKK